MRSSSCATIAPASTTCARRPTSSEHGLELDARRLPLPRVPRLRGRRAGAGWPELAWRIGLDGVADAHARAATAARRARARGGRGAVRRARSCAAVIAPDWAEDATPAHADRAAVHGARPRPRPRRPPAATSAERPAASGDRGAATGRRRPAGCRSPVGGAARGALAPRRTAVGSLARRRSWAGSWRTPPASVRRGVDASRALEAFDAWEVGAALGVRHAPARLLRRGDLALGRAGPGDARGPARRSSLPRATTTRSSLAWLEHAGRPGRERLERVAGPALRLARGLGGAARRRRRTGPPPRRGSRRGHPRRCAAPGGSDGCCRLRGPAPSTPGSSARSDGIAPPGSSAEPTVPADDASDSGTSSATSPPAGAALDWSRGASRSRAEGRALPRRRLLGPARARLRRPATRASCSSGSRPPRTAATARGASSPGTARAARASCCSRRSTGRASRRDPARRPPTTGSS